MRYLRRLHLLPRPRASRPHVRCVLSFSRSRTAASFTTPASFPTSLSDSLDSSLAGELDVLFHNRISARKFASTTVDQFAQSNAAHGGGDKADKGEKEHIERAV